MTGERAVRRGTLFGVVALMLWTGASTSAVGATCVSGQGVASALNQLRDPWFQGLGGLSANARMLASSYDTLDFVTRPNLPYVYAHFGLGTLGAAGIEVALIVDRRGTPLFWRRTSPVSQRGFRDARDFFAELPPLTPSPSAGVAGFAGATALKNGPLLLVSMPIVRSGPVTRALGWVILGRNINRADWPRYADLAHVPTGALDPLPSRTPCAVVLPSPTRTAVTQQSTPPPGTRVVGALAWMLAAALLAGLAALGVHLWARPRRRASPPGPVSPPTANVASDAALAVRPAPTVAAQRNAMPAGERLSTMLAEQEATYRFQPQIDMRTGHVAGVEAILCVQTPSGYAPANRLISEIESAGLGTALAEDRLQAACRAQVGWLRSIGHDFPIGVPISSRTLANANFSALVKRILAEHALAPSLVEIQVTESGFGIGGSVTRCLAHARIVREAGLSFAIDGVNAANVNLRLLTVLPISKLRVDPWPLTRMNDSDSNGLLFDALFGAARGLGITVCVTNVGTPEILAAVLRHGRPLAQGSELGEPRDATGMFELLRGDCDTMKLRQLRCAEMEPTLHAAAPA